MSVIRSFPVPHQELGTITALSVTNVLGDESTFVREWTDVVVSHFCGENPIQTWDEEDRKVYLLSTTALEPVSLLITDQWLQIDLPGYLRVTGDFERVDVVRRWPSPFKDQGHPLMALVAAFAIEQHGLWYSVRDRLEHDPGTRTASKLEVYGRRGIAYEDLPPSRTPWHIPPDPLADYQVAHGD